MNKKTVTAARLNRHTKACEAIISGKGTAVGNIGVKTALTIINNTPPSPMAKPLNLNEFIVQSLQIQH